MQLQALDLHRRGNFLNQQVWFFQTFFHLKLPFKIFLAQNFDFGFRDAWKFYWAQIEGDLVLIHFRQASTVVGRLQGAMASEFFFGSLDGHRCRILVHGLVLKQRIDYQAVLAFECDELGLVELEYDQILLAVLVGQLGLLDVSRAGLKAIRKRTHLNFFLNFDSFQFEFIKRFQNIHGSLGECFLLPLSYDLLLCLPRRLPNLFIHAPICLLNRISLQPVSEFELARLIFTRALLLTLLHRPKLSRRLVSDLLEILVPV